MKKLFLFIALAFTSIANAQPKKISALPSSIAVVGDTDVLPIVQSGVTNKITPNDLNVLKYGSLTITSAQVLTLFDTARTLVAAPGVGYAIMPVDAFFIGTYNSVAYTTHKDLQIFMQGSTIVSMVTMQNALAFTGNNGKIFVHNTGSITPATDNQIIENAAMKIWTPVGNPASGNSSIKIYFSYRIVKL